jgi:hypothetical protein
MGLILHAQKKIILCFYIMCQILVFNLINTIVTDMEGIIRIDRLPLGLGTDQWGDTTLASGNIISIFLRTTTLGQSV